MAEISDIRGQAHICETCDARFIILNDETAICCPICRMNRVRPIE